MPRLRLVLISLALTCAACGGRSAPAGLRDDAGTGAGDGPSCPPGAPDEGTSCSLPGTATCDYYLPGPCPGAVDVCRCRNGSWHCEVSVLDGGTCTAPGDAAADGALAFCAGTTPHMVANGMESHPAVTGTALPLNCCDAGELVVVTQTVPMELVPIVVMWRAQVGQTTLPATVDLANLPTGWDVQVYVGCDPAQGGCHPAPDSYASGLQGTLQVSRAADGRYDVTLCLAVGEPVNDPHPLLHSLELYAPHVASGY